MLGAEKRETLKERGERKEREAALLEAAAEKRAAFERRLKGSIDALLKTEAGRTLFVHLFHVCGYAQADVPIDKLGKVEDGLLLYNATRRAIYIKLRDLAPKDLLLQVEAEAEKLAELSAVSEEKQKEGGSNA